MAAEPPLSPPSHCDARCLCLADRGDVPKGSTEVFFRKVKFWKGDAPPIFVRSAGKLPVSLPGLECLLVFAACGRRVVPSQQKERPFIRFHYKIQCFAVPLGGSPGPDDKSVQGVVVCVRWCAPLTLCPARRTTVASLAKNPSVKTSFSCTSSWTR